MNLARWGLVTVGLVLAVAGCKDKAEPKYTECVALERESVPKAREACEAAVRADPLSEKGRAAAAKLPALEKLKREEVENAVRETGTTGTAPAGAEQARLYPLLVQAEAILLERQTIWRRTMAENQCQLAIDGDRAARKAACGDTFEAGGKRIRELEQSWTALMTAIGDPAVVSRLKTRWKAANDNGEYIAETPVKPATVTATATATATETPSSPFPPDPFCTTGRGTLAPQYGPVRFREKVAPCGSGDVCGFFYLAASSLTCQDGGDTAAEKAKKMLSDSGVSDGTVIVLIDVNGRRAAGIVFPSAETKQAFLTALGKPEDKLFTSYAVWRAYPRQQ